MPRSQVPRLSSGSDSCRASCAWQFDSQKGSLRNHEPPTDGGALTPKQSMYSAIFGKAGTFLVVLNCRLLHILLDFVLAPILVKFLELSVSCAGWSCSIMQYGKAHTQMSTLNVQYREKLQVHAQTSSGPRYSESYISFADFVASGCWSGKVARQRLGKRRRAQLSSKGDLRTSYICGGLECYCYQCRYHTSIHRCVFTVHKMQRACLCGIDRMRLRWPRRSSVDMAADAAH